MEIKNTAEVNKSEFQVSITLRIAPPILNLCASNTISHVQDDLLIISQASPMKIKSYQ
jgi:hypothetical protein